MDRTTECRPYFDVTGGQVSQSGYVNVDVLHNIIKEHRQIKQDAKLPCVTNPKHGYPPKGTLIVAKKSTTDR